MSQGSLRNPPNWRSKDLSSASGNQEKGRSCMRTRTRGRRPFKSRSRTPKDGTQAPGHAGTLTLVGRLELVKRGMRPLELASLLGIGKSTLYDWVDAGTIPAYRHRGVIFFDPALIAIWLRRQAT